jgi:predicted MFS family arabinose efflux permease
MNFKEAVGKHASKLLLLALVVALLSTTIIDLIIPLFLVEIAQTFHVTVATANQITTYAQIASVVPALLLGFLAVRFKQKWLLVAGILCISLAAIGSFGAQSLATMQFFYSFNGVGSVLVSAMALAIIGEFYPLDKKPHAVAIITSTGFISRIIGAPIGSFVYNFGGWRATFSLLVFPISIIALVFSLWFIPNLTKANKQGASREPYWVGFKEIFKRKSATFALIFQFFFIMLFALTTFVTAFFKESFGISNTLASWLIVGSSICGISGSLISGLLVVKFGRKNVAVFTGLVSSMLAMVAFYLPSLWIVVSFRYASMFFWAITLSASASFMLEQVPKYRGSMMSLRVAFAGIGTAVGVYIGGLILTSFNYQTMGLTLGTLSIIGSLILFLSKEPGYTGNLPTIGLPRANQHNVKQSK